MGVSYTRNYICDQCKINKHIGGKSDVLPDGWIELRRERKGIMDEPATVCSVACALELLNEWAEELKYKWRKGKV